MAAYKVIQSDPSNGIYEGQTIQPHYDDANEVIFYSTMPGVLHHITKNGKYFKDHLREVK